MFMPQVGGETVEAGYGIVQLQTAPSFAGNVKIQTILSLFQQFTGFKAAAGQLNVVQVPLFNGSCRSNTGIYSMGASTVTVCRPSNTSPVEVSFQLPSGR